MIQKQDCAKGWLYLLVLLLRSACRLRVAQSELGHATPKDSADAELFTIPQEQMSHVQVVGVRPTTLTRTLGLTAAVAYNAFRTTPVITQVSGPVSRIVVVPGNG